MSPRTLITAIGMTLLLVFPVAALANAYKCTDAQGRVTFSDIPCPSNAASSKKIMGRGAGYNQLTQQEKSEFKLTYMSRCKYPRNVCECIATQTADALVYEEMEQLSRAKSYSEVPSIVQKVKKIERSCRIREAQQ